MLSCLSSPKKKKKKRKLTDSNNKLETVVFITGLQENYTPFTLPWKSTLELYSGVLRLDFMPTAP